MFSGIVEERGSVLVNGIAAAGRLQIAASAVLSDVAIGDSIAVNGCCLTVVEAEDDSFTADVMSQTASATNLGALKTGDPVNLEASLRLGDRIGGHLVTGHIDAPGEVTHLVNDGNARWVTVRAPADVLRRTVSRGCIAVDGISLTIVDVDDTASTFRVSLIPHTMGVTTAGTWTVGSRVNLEADMMARYAERLLGADAVPA